MTSVIRPLILAAVVGLLLVSKPATALAQLEVAPGYDLWTTDPATTQFFLSPVLGFVPFEGVPIGDFDFGGALGVHDVGTTDTIIRRLDTASVAAAGETATIDIEMVALQLRSVNPIDLGAGSAFHYITLRGNQPQAGVMDVKFNDAEGGTYDLLFGGLEADVRIGAIDGPILAVSTSDLFPFELIPWLREPAQASLQIDGVNTNLNGAMTTDLDMWAASGGTIFASVSQTAPPGQLGLVATVPEPSSVVLAAIGLLSLLGFGRRRGRRRC